MVIKKMNLFSQEAKGYGFQVHKLEKIKCDATFRSARVNDDIRIIFSQQGPKIILLYVDHHDEAYRWAEGKSIRTNIFNAAYLDDSKVTIGKARELEQQDHLEKFQENTYTPPLLEKFNITIKDLIKLGIEEVHAKNLFQIKDDSTFLSYISVFPSELSEGLLDIITENKTITQVYAELQDTTVYDDRIENALLHKDSKRRFYPVEDFNEFESLLEESMETWQVFLHPQQEHLVTRDYNGPALIEGGPGTGKTVVGIHRAAFLAKNTFPSSENKKILLCTFSKKLARYIERKLERLLKQKRIDNNITVSGVDYLINWVLNQNGLVTDHIDMQRFKDVFEETYLQLNCQEPLSLYRMEYYEVIQKYQIKTLDEYLQVDRRGLGFPLQSTQRRRIWDFFKIFLERKETLRLVDFEDRAHLLNDALRKRDVSPIYDSIIIDEAQDLSPAKLKAIIGLVRTEKNNVMLLSDQNQRIYQFKSWKESVNVSIVGRTYHLYVNYRTTKQIREYADRQFMHAKPVNTHLSGYKSLLMGPDPIIEGFSEVNLQYNYICRRIKKLLEAGINNDEICVVSPTNLGHIEGILQYEKIPVQRLNRDNFPRAKNGVGVSTLQGIKGLEFRSIIIANFDKIADHLKKIMDMCCERELKRMEECLKYVAITRAREEVIITYVER